MHEQNVDGGGSTSLRSCAPKYFKLVPLSRASELLGLGQDRSRAKQQDQKLVVRCRRNITHMANDKMYSVYWCLLVSIGVYVYHSRRCVVHTAVSLSHHIRQPSLLRHSIGRRSIRMAFPACTYMQESCACSASPGIIVGAWRVFVIADVVANVHPSTAIYACGHPFSVCQRRPAQHRGELMCFGVPQSEGIDLMAGLPCCDHTRLGDFLRFARAVKHAAQSDAGLPESSTADVVSGGNVIVLLNPDSMAQAAARQCRTCCATKHSFGRPGAVVGAHIASAVLSPRLMARSTLGENHS